MINLNNIDDDQLVQQCKNEHTKQQAYTSIIKKYQEKLYNHIRRILVEHEDTNDVLQNTCIKIWKSIHLFRGESQLYTWLYRIATNETLTYLQQKKKKRAIDINALSNQFTQSLKADSHFNPHNIEWKLQLAIQKLPTKQQIVFNLRYFDETPYEEMSQMLDTSEGALKASYHQAVKKIEQFLKEE